MAKSKGSFDWGAPAEKFPLGMFDDFDGALEVVEYESGDFGAQIHVLITPEEYEFEARNMEYDEDAEQGWPQQWFGMGGDVDTYEISDDGLEIDSGPAPQRNTRAVKFILAARENGVKMKGTSLASLQGAEFHWKATIETSRNPQTKEKVERAVLYPVGKYVGKAVLGGEKAETGKAGRRGRREAEAEVETEDGEEETKPTRGRRGSGSGVAKEEKTARGRGRTSKADKEDDEEKETTTTSEAETDGDLQEQALEALVDIIEAEEDGIAVRKVGTELMKRKDDFEAAVIQEAAKRTTIDLAVERGLITKADGVLKVAEEE